MTNKTSLIRAEFPIQLQRPRSITDQTDQTERSENNKCIKIRILLQKQRAFIMNGEKDIVERTYLSLWTIENSI